MSYIDLENVEITLEMRQWINHESESFRWKLGDKLIGNGIWRQQRQKVGIWLGEEDAIVFSLKFNLSDKVKDEDC